MAFCSQLTTWAMELRLLSARVLICLLRSELQQCNPVVGKAVLLVDTRGVYKGWAQQRNMPWRHRRSSMKWCCLLTLTTRGSDIKTWIRRAYYRQHRSQPNTKKKGWFYRHRRGKAGRSRMTQRQQKLNSKLMKPSLAVQSHQRTTTTKPCQKVTA